MLYLHSGHFPSFPLGHFYWLAIKVGTSFSFCSQSAHKGYWIIHLSLSNLHFYLIFRAFIFVLELFICSCMFSSFPIISDYLLTFWIIPSKGFSSGLLLTSLSFNRGVSIFFFKFKLYPLHAEGQQRLKSIALKPRNEYASSISLFENLWGLGQ